MGSASSTSPLGRVKRRIHDEGSTGSIEQMFQREKIVRGGCLKKGEGDWTPAMLRPVQGGKRIKRETNACRNEAVGLSREPKHNRMGANLREHDSLRA